MKWPQIALLVLMGIEGGIHLARDGECRADYSIGAWCVGATITLSLLYAGGFFS